MNTIEKPMIVSIEKIYQPKSEYTPEELMDGAILTLSQKLLIQRHITEVAQDLCNLDYHPEHPLLFTQQHASLKGQIAAFQHILDMSTAAEEIALEVARQNALKNQQQ